VTAVAYFGAWDDPHNQPPPIKYWDPNRQDRIYWNPAVIVAPSSTAGCIDISPKVRNHGNTDTITATVTLYAVAGILNTSNATKAANTLKKILGNAQYVKQWNAGAIPAWNSQMDISWPTKAVAGYPFTWLVPMDYGGHYILLATVTYTTTDAAGNSMTVGPQCPDLSQDPCVGVYNA